MKPLNILHLEDNPHDGEFVKAILETEHLAGSITRLCTRAEFLAALEKGDTDLVISDFTLPGFDGLTALKLVREKWPHLPFILVSGTVGEEFAIDSLKSGATDYVLKQRIFRLVPAVRRAMKEVADRTERLRLEEQFYRSQRMESIGALAGGIAHDLNNALVPILVGTQLLQHDNPTQAELARILEMISGSAQRCSQMVKQILTFARGARGQAVPLQLRHLIDEILKIAAKTFPKSITIQRNLTATPWLVNGDATELHQLLMNLCVNARDAMPDGGDLTVTTAAAETLAPEVARQFPNATPGPYLIVSVADTGAGIPPELLARIFEPFFTTKAADKGTGLGLSTVTDIVRRHHGLITVKSEVGQGTEFTCHLPAIVSAAPELAPPKEAPMPVGHGECVLIVDDEQAVLELAKTALEGHGYRTLTAPNGLEAISCFQSNRDQIKVLLTDTDMPFLNGLNMIRAIQNLEPGIPIIMASGGKRDPEQLQQIDTSRVHILNKPYDLEQLLNGVTAALHVKQ